jgi:hypothetical protein
MANFVLDETATNINTAINKVLNPDGAPTVTDALITSQGVKTAIDTAVLGVNTNIASVQSDLTALQNTVNTKVEAILTLPTTSYNNNSFITTWNVDDPFNIITYNSSSGKFKLNQNSLTASGVFAITITFNADDSSTNTRRFDLKMQVANSTSYVPLMSLDNAQNTDNGFRSWSAIFSNNYFPTNYQEHRFYLEEAIPNTTLTLTNTVCKITKLT